MLISLSDDFCSHANNVAQLIDWCCCLIDRHEILNIHCSHKMIPNDFGDILAFSVLSPRG